MAQVDLGKVRLTDAELSEKIIQINGGVKFGKDADGNPGYVVTDAETGADTVVPFSSRGKGGLPERGAICFAGATICCIGNTTNYYVCSLFDDVPIEISKVEEIKTITTIKKWYRTNSGYTSNLSRNMYIYLITEDTNGANLIYSSSAVIGGAGTNDISVQEKEFIFPKNQILNDRYIRGIGCRFSQYGGGSSQGYYFTSQIGSIYNPDDAKMEYIIS